MSSALLGFLAGGAAAGGFALVLTRRRRDALLARLAEVEAAERTARETLATDNADLRRRIEAVADAVLARDG